MSEAKTTLCRHCGKSMASYVQPLTEARRAKGCTEPNVYVTCKEEGCPMKDYTFAESAYAEADLTDYLEPKLYKW